MDYAFLDEILREDQISDNDTVQEEHSHDWGTRPEDGVPPAVVVWPESTKDVSAVLREASEREIPVTPFAAGTSLEGNPIPLEGGISLDVSRMDAVVDIRPDDFQITVQPGIIGSDVNDALQSHGLFFPPLPSSGKISTIGGMIANDASGMLAVKYGEIHDWILHLEAVLANGTVIETGSRAAKTSAGYNVLDLLVGSEGTLAVVTEATLELAGRPEQIWGGRVIFNDRTEASKAVSDIVQSGVDVAKIELIDAVSAEMTNKYLGTDLPDLPMIFLEFHANHDIKSEVEFCRTILDAYETVKIGITESGDEMQSLWEVREEMANALEPYDPDLTPLTPGDVTVPISHFASLLDYIASLEDEHDVLIPCFGHAGDGNIHYTVLVRAGDKEHRAHGERVSKEIVKHAIELGGTSTGEHGVGLGKQDYLAEEFGDDTVALMGQIKDAFDPNGILNPGKVLPYR